MPAIARIGDTTFGTCPLDHSGAKGVQTWTGPGVIISGSGTTFADGSGVARLGDAVSLGKKHVQQVLMAAIA